MDSDLSSAWIALSNLRITGARGLRYKRLSEVVFKRNGFIISQLLPLLIIVYFDGI